VPLLHGSSPAVVHHNIREMVAAGHPVNQAVAAALHVAGHHARHMASGGYLSGTAGSPMTPVPTSYVPQQPTSPGYNAAGFMNTPQVGSYQLDPNTGALTGASQAALQQYAMRGLNGLGGAATSTPNTISAGNGAAPTIPGGGGESVGSNGASGAKSNALDLSFGNTVSFDPKGALSGAAKGALAGPIGAVLGGIYGGTNISANTNIGGPDGASDTEIAALGRDAQGNVDNGAAGLKRGGRSSGGIATAAEMGDLGPRTRALDHPSGLVASPIGGRSDHIHMGLGANSYVVPADVISGMGQGNTMAGGHAFDAMIHGGPYGTALPMPKLGGTFPATNRMPKIVGAHHFSRGGQARAAVPTIVAGGERIVSPEEVARLSGGDMKKGHAMLDKWVVAARNHIIKHTKKLPGPVGAKK